MKTALRREWKKQATLLRQILPVHSNKLTPTKVFAIAGLDGKAIGSKSLINLSSGLTL
jgi:hypothetical protein